MPFKTNGLTRVLLVLSILFLSSSLFAQQTITGKVIGGADNQPVPFDLTRDSLLSEET